MESPALNRRSSRRFTATAVFAVMTITLLVMTGLTNHVAAQSSARIKRKIVSSVQPDYPYVLRNAHFEGQVKLEATVQPNGSVTKVDIKGGNPMLSQYAQMAVMHWKYAPGPAQTVEEVVFTFNSNSADTK